MGALDAPSFAKIQTMDGFTCTNCIAHCELQAANCEAQAAASMCSGLENKMLAAKIKVAFRVAIWVNHTVVYGRRCGDSPLINSSA